MTAYVDQFGYDGVNVDFEVVRAEDRNALTSFVAELAARLHARGKVLSQAVSAKTVDVMGHPRSTAFDYVELSKHVDAVFVMAWGIHWATSAPGAIRSARLPPMGRITVARTTKPAVRIPASCGVSPNISVRKIGR